MIADVDWFWVVVGAAAVIVLAGVIVLIVMPEPWGDG